MQTQNTPQHLKKRVVKILKLVFMATLFVVSNSFAQTVNFSFAPATVNVGDTITFTNTSTGFAAGTRFVWNFGERCYLDTANYGNNPFNADLCNDTVYCTCTRQHIFNQARPYKVTLKACTPTGVCFDYNTIVNIVTPALSIPPCPELICNGGFENLITGAGCPYTFVNLGYYAVPPQHATLDCWFNPNFATPDYFITTGTCKNTGANNTQPNFAFGCAYAHTGQSFVGLVTRSQNINGPWREYVTQQIPALQNGVTYNLTFYAQMTDGYDHATNLGIMFSSTNPFQPIQGIIGSPVLVTPIYQDKNNWVLYAAQYIANGTEQYISIGNYQTDAQQSIVINNAMNCSPVQVIVPNEGYTLLDDVSLQTAFATVTSNIGSPTICVGQSVTLTANLPLPTHAVGYQWSNGSSNASITVSPTVTTQYAVIVTDQFGCTFVATFTVNVVTSIPDPIINGAVNNHSICLSDRSYYISNTSSFPSNTIFTWSATNATLSATTGSTVSIANWINTSSVVTLTAFATLGTCTSAIASYIIAPCCQPFSGTTGVNLDLSNLSASTVMQNIANYPGFVVYDPAGTGIELITDIAVNPSYQAAINGVFLVDIDMNIAGSNVVLGPDARIEVVNGATLTISEASWLHTCNQQYMWDRIDVAAGCNLIIKKDVLIEEAQLAIVINGDATISSRDNVTFNRNYKSIEFIGNYNSQYYKSAIANTKFTSINLTTNALAPIGVPPYAVVRSHIGISATNLLASSSFIGLQIGNYTINNPMAFDDVAPNIFNNLDLGIDAENCDLAVYNCNFYTINDDLNPTILKGISGTAISSVGIKTLQPATTTTIGGNFIDPLTNPVTLMPNNFIDCKRGVFISEINATVAYNHFLRNTYTGIAFKNGAYYQVTADSNDFINCNRGIAAREMGNATVLISRNYYNFDNNYVTINTLKFDFIAFSINNGVKSRVAGFMQGNNYCKGFKNCFALTNVDGYTIAFNNPIIMDMNGPGSPYGIRILGGDDNRLYNNKIEYNGSNSSTNTLWRGISIETCANTLIFSNTMQKLGTGLRFFNCHAQNYVQCNNFDACYRGVELNSSYIGNQGHNNQPNSLPSGNLWQNQPVAALDVKGIGSFVSSTWYVISSTPPDAPTAQDPPGPIPAAPAPFAVVTGTPQQLNCNPPAVNDDAHVERLLMVIQQMGYYNQLSDEAKYSAVAQAYVELDANKTLMERGTAQDEILRLFYDSISQTDIGMLLEVNQQIQNNDTATASAINKYVSGHYSQDENAALVNETYIRHLDDEAFMLNDNETSILENIAYQNPMEGGTAVYGAMVLLDLNLNHEFYGYTLRQMQATQATTDTYYSVYPNPASDKIVVLRKQLTEGANQILVSNTIGEVVYNASFEASQGMHLINTSNWQKGIYFIQIINNTQAVFNFKVVIIK